MTRIKIKEDDSIYEIQSYGAVSDGKHRMRICEIIEEIRKQYHGPSSGFWEPFQRVFLDSVYSKELEVISCDFELPKEEKGTNY